MGPTSVWSWHNFPQKKENLHYGGVEKKNVSQTLVNVISIHHVPPIEDENPPDERRLSIQSTDRMFIATYEMSVMIPL